MAVRSGTAFQVVNELMYETCMACGTAFAVESRLYAKLRDNHHAFYCPNGHGQSFIEKTEAEKLREELARKEMNLQTERTLRLEAERATARLKKRVANGVCPCCTRSFVNLGAHMKQKHPDLLKKEPTQI